MGSYGVCVLPMRYHSQTSGFQSQRISLGFFGLFVFSYCQTREYLLTEDNLQNVHPLVPGVDAPVLGARLHLLEPVFSCELQPTATAASCQRFSLILGALQAHLEGRLFAPFLEIDFADQVSQLLPSLLGRVKYQPTERVSVAC